jgi:NADPH-dependent glutamate synthase beta subunit-like oxidoreductase/NAD-dependent dihydropyrimidine dehydrogenase PreA subunit
MNSLDTLAREARALLDRQRPDAVIEHLRGGASNGSAALCALLAEAYFMRGDTRGDLYSAHFFADRAIGLGESSTALLAIKAISAFRKEQFAEAAATFAEYATETSPAATRYSFGLALLRAGDAAGALTWLKGVLAEFPDDTDLREAIAEAELRIANGEPPPAPHPEKRRCALGGVNQTRETGVDTPYPTNALSKLAGVTTHAKDQYWLAKNIPCQKGCPAHTDVPGYLTEIYNGNYDAAYLINLKDNVFPAVLGRVCARPCEPECRHGWEGLGESIAICFSKRAAADLKESAPVVLEPLFEKSGKRVAIVGSGVAGLATARNLAWYGHSVTVYEKHNKPGGMMNQGIPVFRLPREHIEREIKQIELMGVEIICKVEVGRDIPLSSLLEENDAVVMAAGTLRPNMLDLPGKELSGIRHGLDFLLEANETGEADVPEKVVVIGGGFTAMDCARTAKRLGAKLVQAAATEGDWHDIALPESGADVNVLYRRSVDEMLVTPGELEELEHESIGMEILISPVEYLGKDGKLKGVRFIRNELGEPDGSGRRRPVPVAGSEFDVEADLVLLATGQFPDTDWIDDDLKPGIVGNDGWVLTENDIRTANPKLFVAGDFSTGASSLIHAIKYARKCARELDTALMGRKRLAKVAIIEDVTESGRIREMDYVDVQPMPMLPLDARTTSSEVECGYEADLSVDEAQRCYRCNLKFEIDSDKCIYCDWCIKAKPRPDCIVKVKELTYGDKGEITGFVRSTCSEDTNLIYINQEDCIRCGACVDACPVDCISIQKVTRTTAPCPTGC